LKTLFVLEKDCFHFSSTNDITIYKLCKFDELEGEGKIELSRPGAAGGGGAKATVDASRKIPFSVATFLYLYITSFPKECHFV
jgi:hypothetical protein